MNVLFGNVGIVVEDTKTTPSSLELCRMDKRLLYIGTVPDLQGNQIQNAFLHVLKPNRFYTIEEAKLLKERLLLLKTKMHYFDEKSQILNDIYKSYCGEIYVGDVCEGTGEIGTVWHDAYKKSLSSTQLYTKNEDRTHITIEPPYDNCFSVPDRFGFRLVVKTPDTPEQHYAFFYGISAFNQWTRLQYYAEEGQEVFHNLDPDYKKFLYWDECQEFEKYPELVKAYPKCYSQEGFLNTKR